MDQGGESRLFPVLEKTAEQFRIRCLGRPARTQRPTKALQELGQDAISHARFSEDVGLLPKYCTQTISGYTISPFRRKIAHPAVLAGAVLWCQCS